MKVIIDIDDYVLDTDIDSDWVSVCNDELAESLNNAVKLSDVLQEIRQKITNLVKTYPFIDHMDSYVKETEVLEIFDKRLKELSE
jgi:hypothetical protein